MFKLPEYVPPDFSRPCFLEAPDAAVSPAMADGLLPDDFHATTIYPEYIRIGGQWRLIEAPRMDCAVVIRGGAPWAVEPRLVRAGDAVVTGRQEDGSHGVYVDDQAFVRDRQGVAAQSFAFRTGRSRESSYSLDYDLLYDILRHDRDHGYIVWVLGPATVFDHDARRAMARIIRHGYAHALFAGNALATHDLEASLYETALGQHIYTKEPVPDGHYNHLETINRVRRAGSMEALIRKNGIADGVIAACVSHNVPVVLAGSIRDDGPLPEVIGDAYRAQAAMREHTRRATTVIGLATQLHTIATGNMTPAWQRAAGGGIRPVFFYTVDVSEFAVNKLRDRGSLSVNSIVTNIQDFLVNAERNLVPAREA